VKNLRTFGGSTGSLKPFCGLSLLVRSVTGERQTAAAGKGNPSSRSFNKVVRVKLRPAESLPMAILLAVYPNFLSTTYTQSNTLSGRQEMGVQEEDFNPPSRCMWTFFQLYKPPFSGAGVSVRKQNHPRENKSAPDLGLSFVG